MGQYRKRVRGSEDFDACLLAAIEHIPVPAFVVSRGLILAANAPGHSWLTDEPARHAALTSQGGPDPDVFAVTRSTTGAEHYLALLRDTTRRSMRRQAPRCWGLTAQEHEIAESLARGATTAQLARKLDCSQRSVERHVRNIVKKAVAATEFSLCPHERCEVVNANLVTVIDARLAAASRQWSLTPRQTEVLELLAKGLPNARIASDLGCAEATVEIHVSRILERANVDSRASLLATLLWAA